MQVTLAMNSTDPVAALRQIIVDLNKVDQLAAGQIYLKGMVFGNLRDYASAISTLSELKPNDGEGLYRAAQLDIAVFGMAAGGGKED